MTDIKTIMNKQEKIEFVGKITDQEYYDWVLSAEEIHQIHNNEITPDELRAKHIMENDK